MAGATGTESPGSACFFAANVNHFTFDAAWSC
jgi:hypothetical protein